MELHVQLDGEGFLPDKFGKFCAPADRDGERLCRRSFPLSLTGLPQGTQAVAWVLLDWDSVPVCGFPWIHWCGVLSVAAAAAEVSVPEDASRRGVEGLREGHSSLRHADGSFGVGYVGPCPPDKTHAYTLHAVALDAAPELPEGRAFWANELVGACKGHVLAEAAVDLPSRS